jgi:hypothetical protein
MFGKELNEPWIEGIEHNDTMDERATPKIDLRTPFKFASSPFFFIF